MRRLLETARALDKRLLYIVVFFVVLSSAWILLYALGGHAYYAEGASGLSADIFRAVGSNLAFFGLFGLATLVPSFVQPRQEPIDRRLGFLITSDRVSPIAHDFIKGEIVKLCGYLEKADITLRLRKFDPDSGAFMVEQRSYSTFRNTFRSEEYTDAEFKVVVHPDLAVDAVSGGIDLAEFIHGSLREEIMATPLTLELPVAFEQTVPLRIARDATADYRMHCWLWFRPTDDYYLYLHRFAEDARIVVANDLDRVVYLRSPGLTRSPVELLPKARVEVHRGTLSPGKCSIMSLSLVADE